MSERKIRIGIIGVGQIGKHHLDNYAKLPGADVAAVCDIDVPELKRVSEVYRIKDTYIKYRDLLKREDIEAVDVCLHNNLHAPVTMAALEAGKHVYCEKPMAGAYPDAKAMLETARKLGRKLSIQLSTLFAKETKVAKRLIDDGKLGKLYHARSCGFRRRGRPFVDGYGSENFVKKEIAAGGALFDMGVYHISQLLYLLGQPPVERVTGKTYQETDMDPRRRKSSGYSVEELGLGFVRFTGGLTLDIIESWAIHRNNFEGSSLVGTQGGITLSPFSYHSIMGDVPFNATFEIDDADWRWHKILDDQDANDSPQHHWIAALQGRVPLLPTAEIALQTMLISQGIYLSEQLGREVTVEEIEKNSVSTALKV
ncbi:MAG: Gfo/Idh/MocA family oxidoreductase [Candidatus Hydrogenedentes bacterium]|nr:Gfo/Idh/MocA family oxidoreductase [Candidatus Hydrogenedentota bacterium]